MGELQNSCRTGRELTRRLRRIYDALESESKPPLKDLDALLLPPESLGSDEELEGLEIDEEKEGQMDVEEQLKAMEANLAALNQKVSPALGLVACGSSTCQSTFFHHLPLHRTCSLMNHRRAAPCLANAHS